MNEEIRNYEENESTELEVYEEPKTSGNGVLGFVLGGLAIAATTTAIVLHKTKSKREAKRVEKLRKKGYVVLTPEEVEELAVDPEDYETIEE